MPDVSLPVVKNVAFFGDAIGHTNLLTWIGLLLVPLLTVILFRTRRGLRLRSVGEKPHAADTVGVSVIRTRYAAVVISGMLAARRRRLPVDGSSGRSARTSPTAAASSRSPR